jgi:hypothetical protein
MRTDRWLLGAFVFLASGLWLTFEWGHGNVGLSAAFPVSGTRLTIDVFTTGWPVITGLPLVVVGLFLMLIAVVSALIAQFHRPDHVEADSITRLNIPFQE